jgi:hypothetical protein
MIPVPPEHANLRMGQPKNWDEAKHGPVRVLAVRRDTREGMTTFTSWWKPSLEELNALSMGGVVELEVCTVQPPVSIGVVLTDSQLEKGCGYDEHGPDIPRQN